VSALPLVRHQARFEMRAYWRNTRARIFTVFVPVALLLILVALFGSSSGTTAGGHKLKIGAYYAPHIAAMAIVGAAMVNLLISIVSKRESGSLKRRRATPVPSWVLIAADAATSIVSGLIVVAVLIAIGLGFGLTVNGPAIGVALVVSVVGAASFCCMAYALSTVVGSADSAGPMVQLATLPVYFISGIYIPDNVLPHWVVDIAEVLPVRPLAVALQAAFVPATNGGARFALVPVLIVLAWGVAGLLIAVRRFSWSPRRS
jgi:ABC-2 type transport system permease protein